MFLDLLKGFKLKRTLPLRLTSCMKKWSATVKNAPKELGMDAKDQDHIDQIQLTFMS